MACNTDKLSENITKLFNEETYTYVKALLIASTFAVKNTATISQSITSCPTSRALMEGINMEKSSQGCYKAMQLSQ